MGKMVAGRMAVYHLCFLVFGVFAFIAGRAGDRIPEIIEYGTERGIAVSQPYGNTMFYIVTALFIPLYIYLTYQTVWPWGQRDYNKVKHGRTNHDPLKGLFVGAIASMPGLFLILITVTLKEIQPYGVATEVSELLLQLYYIAFTPLRIITPHPAIYLAALPVLPLVSQLAFRFGYRSYSPLHAIMYKRKK